MRSLDSNSKQIIHVTLTGIIFLSFLLLVVLIPSAEITVYLPQKIIKKNYVFVPDTSLAAILPTLNRIPASEQRKDGKEIFGFKETDVRTFIDAKLNGDVEKEESVIRSSISYSIAINDDETATLLVQAAVVPAIDTNAIKKNLAGKTKKEAYAYLNLYTTSIITSVEIDLYPSWFPFIPFIKKRITIITPAQFHN